MPIVLRGPFTHLATAGGKVTDTTNAYDVAISTDAGCVTIIPSYREVKNVSTGDVSFWFAPATTTHTTNTLLWQCYGNSSYTTDHSTPVGVWDSNYRSVYLFPDGTTLSGVDALGNFTLTNHGATADASGIVGGAVAMAGVYLDVANFSLGGAGDLTCSFWMYSTNFVQDAEIVEKEPVNGDWSVLLTSGGGLQLRGGSSGSAGTAAPSNNAWHYVVAQINHAGSVTGSIYVDGSLVIGPIATVDGIANSTNTLNIGQYTGAGGGFNFNGKLDVIEVSNILRPVDQGIVEYLNQKPSSTLITLGSEVPLGGGAAALPSLGAFVF